MPKSILNSLIALALLFSTSAFTAAPTPPPTPASPHVQAYFTGNEESLASLETYFSYLDMLSIDVYNVQDDGTIVKYDDLGALDDANRQGLAVYACVSNYRGDPLYDFDPTLAQAAIRDHRDTFIKQLLDIARDDRFTGINIDLENIAYSDDIEADRAAFTDLIRELADSLHNMGKQLIVSVPAKSEESPDDDWAYPYDLAALGQAADYLQLMTYDENGPWGDPGPVAGLDWVTKSVAYTAGLVDPAKLLLGLPAYAYDWDLTDYKKGEDDAVGDLYWTDLPDILAKPGAKVQRDAAADSPYLTYSEDGHEHEVWYEDAASISAKAQLISQYHLGGLSVWALGQEDEAFWQAARSGM